MPLAIDVPHVDEDVARPSNSLDQQEIPAPNVQSCSNSLFLFPSSSLRTSPLFHIHATQCSGPVATRPARPSRPWRSHNQNGPLPHQMPSPRPQDGGLSIPQPGILHLSQQHNPQLRKSCAEATRGLPPAVVLGPIANTSCSIVMSERSQVRPSTRRQETMSSPSPTNPSTWTNRTYQSVELYTLFGPTWKEGQIMLTVCTGSSARLAERSSTR